MKTSEADAFWSRLDKSGECWLWRGAHVPAGYGKLYFRGSNWYAHRLAYTLANGDIPDRMHVCHTCDNPPCCNPAHLWVGTAQDNMQDRERKGRGVRSQALRESLSWIARKLTPEQAVQIRLRYAAGNISFEQLGSEYGVHRNTIKSVVHGYTFRYAQPETIVPRKFTRQRRKH